MAPTSTTKATPSSAAKGKGKAKAPPAASEIGAPAQYSQKQRKGKKAWRKNIDVQDVEKGMEMAREEERITGGTGVGSEGAAYFIDTVGDVEVAKRMKKPVKPLRSLAILSARSAVPSLTARASHTSSKPSSSSNTRASNIQTKVSSKDKARLLRIARKAVDGEAGSGVFDSLATKGEQLRDVWTEREVEEQAQETRPAEWGAENRLVSSVLKPSKPPVTIQRQREALLKLGQDKALPVPKEGTSYNPRLESYQALMEEALAEEEERLRKEREEEERNLRAGKVQTVVHEYERGVAKGMTVGEGDKDAIREEEEEEKRRAEEEAEEEEAVEVKKKEQKRKTKQEKAKSKRQAEAKRLLKQQLASKSLRTSLSSLPSISRSVDSTLTSRSAAVAARRAARLEKEAKGLSGGEKVGKYRVKKGAVDVQLGEDLSENLRELKPEGNLFRDRFLSLQHRALVEPRVRQNPKKRTLRTKEYEKHAWKRFE